MIERIYVYRQHFLFQTRLYEQIVCLNNWTVLINYNYNQQNIFLFKQNVLLEDVNIKILTKIGIFIKLTKRKKKKSGAKKFEKRVLNNKKKSSKIYFLFIPMINVKITFDEI